MLLVGCPQGHNVPSNNNTVTGEVSLSTNVDIPLVAYYTKDSVNTEPVTVRVKGKTADMDIAHTYEVGYGKEFPIFGLYPNYENTIEVTENGVIKSFKVKTGVLPEGLPIANVTVDNLPIETDGEYAAFNRDLYWLSSHTNDRETLAFDRKGDIRYYFVDDFSRVAYDIDNDSIVLYKGYKGGHVMDLTGKTIFKYTGTATSHHDTIKLENGNFVWLSVSKWGDEDCVIEQDSNGKLINDYTFGPLFRSIVDVETNDNRDADIELLNKIIYDEDNIYYENGEGLATDWAHGNSLVYDEDSDIMYFSLRNQAVIAVDWSEWKLLWWMADDDLHTSHEGVPYPEYTFHDIKALESYKLTGDAETDGPKNQHALFLHANGNLGMFDNQGDEDSNANGSRYVEYSIDNQAKTGAIARQYRDIDIYSRIRSDADFTINNNLLMLWGNASPEAVIREIDGANLSDSNFENDTVLFEIKLSTPPGYRIDKIPLYPYDDPNQKYSMDCNAKEGI